MRVQDITAEVHQGAAREFVGPARVDVLGCGHDHVDLDGSKLAKFAAVQQLVQPPCYGVIEVVKAFHDAHLCRRRSVTDDPRLIGVAGEGFLGENVLARPDRGEIPRAVQGVGKRVVDRLDLVIGEDVGVAAENSLDSVPAGEVLGASAVPGRDSDEPVSGDAGGPDDGEVRDPGGTKHTDADRGRGHCAGHEDCPGRTAWATAHRALFGSIVDPSFGYQGLPCRMTVLVSVISATAERGPSLPRPLAFRPP